MAIDREKIQDFAQKCLRGGRESTVDGYVLLLLLEILERLDAEKAS